jgi:integrase
MSGNVNAMKALKVASDLAAVGGADLEETTNAVAAAWRRPDHAAGLQPDLAAGVEESGRPGPGPEERQHVTRHTFATELLSNGVSLAKVAAYLGDTKETVLATYAHFLPGDETRARDVMGAFSGLGRPMCPGCARRAAAWHC